MESTTTPKARRPMKAKVAPSPAAIVVSRPPGNLRADIWSETFRIQSLAHLSVWIEQARFILDDLRINCAYDEKLKETLKTKAIEWTFAEWTSEVSEGLIVLHSLQILESQSAYATVEGGGNP